MPILALEFLRQKATGAFSASACSSFHRPRSSAVFRPFGWTAVASMHKAPGFDRAIDPRWTMCQSVARPSSAEHWPIGDTMMRFGNVTDRSVKGVKSWEAMSPADSLMRRMVR
jgi:hypothetical protein